MPTTPGVHTGELIACQLQRLGIDSIFGVVAAPVIPIFAALEESGIRIVTARHEQQAAFMAQAWSVAKQLPGTVLVGSGPAVTNTLTSLYVARENGWPLILLGGSSPLRERAIGSFQELDQVGVVRPVCKWSATITEAGRAPELLRMAAGHAVSGRPGPVYLDIPGDVVTATSSESIDVLVREAIVPTTAEPSSEVLSKVAALVKKSRQPLLVLGDDCLLIKDGAGFEELADLGIPFISSPLARGTIREDHSSHMSAARSMALREADLVLMFGGRFDWMYGGFDRYAGRTRDVSLVQISADEASFFLGADVSVMVNADPGVAASALAATLRAEADLETGLKIAPWLGSLGGQDRSNRMRMETIVKADASKKHLTQISLFEGLKEFIGDEEVLVLDGEVTLATARVMLPGAALPGRRLDTGRTGCMGVGVPYAIGTKVANPNSRVIAVLGDYAFGASAMEVETAERIGAQVVFVVANNAGIVGEELQNAVFGPEGQPVASLIQADYSQMASMVGGFGRTVSNRRELKSALEEAFDQESVAIINVALDPVDHGFTKKRDYLTGGYTVR